MRAPLAGSFRPLLAGLISTHDTEAYPVINFIHERGGERVFKRLRAGDVYFRQAEYGKNCQIRLSNNQ